MEKLENEWMSPKFWETLGYDPKEKKHLASEWKDIIFHNDLEVALENFEKHCKDPSHPYDQIVRYRHKNGSTVWIRCRGLAIRDEVGNPIRMLGAHTDITDLKEAEMQISRLTREYEIVFNGTQDAMYLVEVLENGGFRYIQNNHSHQLKTGISLEQIKNKSPQDLLGKEIGDGVTENFRKCIESRKSVTYEESLLLPGGNRTWLTTLTPIAENNRITHIVGSAEDITVRKKLELKLERSAYYDTLTGLPNRRLFFERLEQIILESKRYAHRFAVLYIDLDGFKGINDAYGHKIGDEVLIAVGNRLSRCVRESDTVARMGGDEFTAIIRSTESEGAVVEVVKKIQKSLIEVIQIGDIECRINSSIGIALCPDHGSDSETLLKTADMAMYAAKRNGKGNFEISS